ncbi:MAG: hypothetical protein M0Z31_06945 [Clostridia bacterium]|nr:hypothetical protein [Clostridia bacterium]
MKTFVEGKIMADDNTANIDGFLGRIVPLGYEFLDGDEEEIVFSKPARIESVITELVPTCEEYGLDVEDFELVEYNEDTGVAMAWYEGGRIFREG